MSFLLNLRPALLLSVIAVPGGMPDRQRAYRRAAQRAQGGASSLANSSSVRSRSTAISPWDASTGSRTTRYGSGCASTSVSGRSPRDGIRSWSRSLDAPGRTVAARRTPPDCAGHCQLGAGRLKSTWHAPAYDSEGERRAHRSRHGRGRGHADALVAAQGHAPRRRSSDDRVAGARGARGGRREGRGDRLPRHDVAPALPDGVETVVQPVADGTGGAVRAALDLVRDGDTVLVLSGDHPMISAEALTELLETHRAAGAAATLMTTELDDPGSYGRIVRDADGEVERIVEAKHPGDATARGARDPRDQHRHVRLRGGAAPRIARPDRQRQRRRASTTSATSSPCSRQNGGRVAAYRSADRSVNLGVNTRLELAEADRVARRRILERHMLAGVTIVDPGAAWIEADVEIEPDATLEPGCVLRGATRIGGGAVVGPSHDPDRHGPRRGRRRPHSYLVECDVLDRCSVGPFAYIRPRTTLREGAKAGAFVEVKDSDVGAGQQDPPPLVHRRRRDRGGRQHRRRIDHRELGWIPQTPDGDRRSCADRG